MKLSIVTITAMLITTPAMADSNSDLDAAIGGGLGGAAGAVIGNEMGGRDGAIIGGAIGGATGTAVTTNKDSQRQHKSDIRLEDSHTRIKLGPDQGSSFCPPGLAKKGRC